MEVDYDELLGEGSFGRVYAGRIVNHSDAPIALKRVRHVDREPTLNPLLRHEACAFVLLGGHPNIPPAYAYGVTRYYEYLAMQRLGISLHSYFVSKKQPLTLGNLASIAYQMLDVLEHVHSRGIINCDVSLANLLFEGQGLSPKIYLIDFGMCFPYIDFATGQHRPDKGIPRLRGNRIYASLNQHLHRSPSRRDDLESLAYLLIRLLRGRLPWGYMPSKSDIYPSKRAWSGGALCVGWPSMFGEFLDYCRGLEYDETPQYQQWKLRFAHAIHHTEFSIDIRPDDSTGLVVGRAAVPQPEPVAPPEQAVDFPGVRSTEWSCFMSTHDYYDPVTEAESVWSLSRDDLLAPSEEEVILRGLHGLTGVPTSNRKYLTPWSPPEELLAPYN